MICKECRHEAHTEAGCGIAKCLCTQTVAIRKRNWQHGDPALVDGTVLPIIQMRAWDPDTRQWLPIRMTAHTAVKAHVRAEIEQLLGSGIIRSNRLITHSHRVQ
jgi:hypothetical protein